MHGHCICRQSLISTPCADSVQITESHPGRLFHPQLLTCMTYTVPAGWSSIDDSNRQYGQIQCRLKTPGTQSPHYLSEVREPSDRSRWHVEHETWIIRCNVCGERSTVTSIAVPATSDEQVDDELVVMRTVGSALSRLRDPAARTRVLRWACDRFEVADTRARVANTRAQVVVQAAHSSTAQVAAEPVALNDDSDLTMQGVELLYSPEEISKPEEIAAHTAAAAAVGAATIAVVSSAARRRRSRPRVDGTRLRRRLFRRSRLNGSARRRPGDLTRFPG